MSQLNTPEPLYHLTVNGSFVSPLFEYDGDCNECALSLQSIGEEAHTVYVSPQNRIKMLQLNKAITESGGTQWKGVF